RIVSMLRHLPRATLSPYTTLFRSLQRRLFPTIRCWLVSNSPTTRSAPSNHSGPSPNWPRSGARWFTPMLLKPLVRSRLTLTHSASTSSPLVDISSTVLRGSVPSLSDQDCEGEIGRAHV